MPLPSPINLENYTWLLFPTWWSKVCNMTVAKVFSSLLPTPPPTSTLIQNSNIFPPLHNFYFYNSFLFTFQTYFPLSLLHFFFYLHLYICVNLTNIYYFFFLFFRKKSIGQMKFLSSWERYEHYAYETHFFFVHLSSSFFLSFI
jgi:hypothetical protein